MGKTNGICRSNLPKSWIYEKRKSEHVFCLGVEMATHPSTLGWKIPWTEERGRLQSTGSQSRTWLSNFTSFYLSAFNWLIPLPSGNINLVGQRLTKARKQRSCCTVAKSCPTLCDSTDCSRTGFPVLYHLTDFGQAHVHWVRFFSPWNSPGKNTGVGSHSLLQKIFPTQDWTRVSCIAGVFFTVSATREALPPTPLKQRRAP